MTTVSQLISEQANANMNKSTWGSVIYNVSAYGAKGDGNADDTIAVQAAINDAVSKNATLVFFPPGTYKVTTLTNTSTINFVGNNATFVGYAGTIQEFGVSNEKFRYSVKNSKLIANFFKKYKNDEQVKISCRGTSITYGQDTFSSDKRAAMSDATLDTSYTRTQEQAGKTYPEVLRNALVQIHPLTTIVNRGISGDYAQSSYTHWTTTCNSDITILELGVNDATSSGCPYMGDVQQFIDWYCKVIEQEIDWNSGVILLKPLKIGDGNSKEYVAYSEAIELIGKAYNCPVIESDEFTQNYNKTIYCTDLIHFNTSGYTIIGNRIASIFLGDSSTPKKIGNGDSLLPIKTLDGVTLYGGAALSYANANTYAPIWDDATNNRVIAKLAPNPTQGVIWSFEVTEDNLCAIPTVYCESGVTVEMILDYYTPQPQNAISIGKVPLNPSIACATNNIDLIINNDVTNGLKFINIAKRGYHTLILRNISASNNAYVDGIQFISLADLKKKINSNLLSYSQNATVTEQRISYDKIMSSLGIFDHGDSYYKATPLKIVLYNFSNNILEYFLVLGQKSTGNGFSFVSAATEIKLTATPTGYRSISSVTWDNATKEIVITFGGNTSALSNFYVSII